MEKPLGKVEIEELSLFKKGKVRDIYELEDKLLIVATDRISAFDYVLPSLIPYKGKVLTQLSSFWFDYTSLVCPNHLITTEVKKFPPILRTHQKILNKRTMLVKKVHLLPAECVVRGYLAGSGWKDYQSTGEICGVKLPKGLKKADRLEEIIFTPATKAEQGHDQNITFKQMKKLLGESLAEKIKEISIELYKKASLYAVKKGIIIADTKFEFGLIDDQLVLVDEIFTPDSSRFWPLSEYAPGQSPPSLDKQFVRDYLESTDWDKKSPPPPLPKSVIEQTSKRYLEIYRLLTGKNDIK